MKQCLVEWQHYLLGAPFRERLDHQSSKWLHIQMSRRSVDAVRSPATMGGNFQPATMGGNFHVLPDRLSRPATEVCVLCLEDSQPRQYVFLTLGAWLHEHQNVVPSSPSVLPVLEISIKIRAPDQSMTSPSG